MSNTASPIHKLLILTSWLFGHCITNNIWIIYNHVFLPQLTCWLEELQSELQSSEIADTVDGAEQLLAQFNQQRDTTLDAAMNTVGEGENLLEQLR